MFFLPRLSIAKTHAYYFGHARLLHGDAVDHVSGSHHAFGVGDHHELRVTAHPAQHFGQTAYVALVQWRVHFVQHAEGAGLILEDADQQRQVP